MAAGGPSLTCITGVVLATYSQTDEMKERWKKADEAAFVAFEKAIAGGGEYSIEDYEGLAEIVEETYRTAHRVTAADAVEAVLKYAWVQLALCNSAVFDAVAFAVVMSMIDFYLEPADGFPDYVNQVLRGVLFANISKPVAPAQIAEAVKHAYEGERAAQLIVAIERGVLVGLRLGLAGGSQDDHSARFQYFGPQDDRNRWFCEYLVKGTNAREPRLYTAKMIGGCLNGFETNVWDDCGGPSCRHVWIKVPAKFWHEFDVMKDFKYLSHFPTAGKGLTKTIDKL